VSTPEEVTFFPYEVDDNEYELIDEKTFESQYTTTYNILERYKEKLLSRKDSRRTWEQLGRPWYSLARIGSPAYFEKTKIVTSIVINEPHFCIDTEGYLFSTGFIHGITPHKTDPYYLVGLLNSQAIFNYLKPICPPKNSGYMKMEVEQLKAAPIYLPDIRKSLCTKFEEVLETQKGNYNELTQAMNEDGVRALVDTTEEENAIAASMLRETSRMLVEENESLTEEDIKILERVNNQLAGKLFNLDDGQLNALSNI
jgi:hypothetical protein